MRFVNNVEPEKFEIFLHKHPLHTFNQTIAFSDFRKQQGWNYEIVGVEENDELIAASTLSYRTTHFSVRYYYACRGLLMDYRDKELLNFFTTSLKKYLKEKKGYVLRIDPYLIDRERDIDGNPIDGIDNTVVYENLKQAGFIKADDIIQECDYEFILKLDESYEDLKKNYHSLTKRMIKRGVENELTVRRIKDDELSKIHAIISATGKRKGFGTRNLSYYKALSKKLGENVYFMLVTISKARLKASKEKKIAEMEEKLAGLKKENRILELKQQIEKEQQNLSDLLSKLSEEETVLSGAVFITYEDEMTFLFGGNHEELSYLGNSYLLHDQMIKLAKDLGKKRYNFYGCPSIDIKDGVYSFKRGFNGQVEKLIGDHLLVTGPYYYLEKTYNSLRKLIGR